MQPDQTNIMPKKNLDKFDRDTGYALDEAIQKAMSKVDQLMLDAMQQAADKARRKLSAADK